MTNQDAVARQRLVQQLKDTCRFLVSLEGTPAPLHPLLDAQQVLCEAIAALSDGEASRGEPAQATTGDIIEAAAALERELREHYPGLPIASRRVMEKHLAQAMLRFAASSAVSLEPTESVRTFYERRLREEWLGVGGLVSGSFFHHPRLPGLTCDSRSCWKYLIRSLATAVSLELQPHERR